MFCGDFDPFLRGRKLIVYFEQLLRIVYYSYQNVKSDINVCGCGDIALSIILWFLGTYCSRQIFMTISNRCVPIPIHARKRRRNYMYLGNQWMQWQYFKSLLIQMRIGRWKIVLLQLKRRFVCRWDLGKITAHWKSLYYYNRGGRESAIWHLFCLVLEEMTFVLERSFC